MNQKTIRICGCLVMLVATALSSAADNDTQTPPSYSNKQLKALVQNATTARDYQRLATYFHYQELIFRAKAQKMMDDYASYGLRYPMATKTVSRVEVESRLYRQYSAKATENAKLAAKYDELLTDLGITPEKVSATTATARSLENAQNKTGSSALLEKHRSAGN